MNYNIFFSAILDSSKYNFRYILVQYWNQFYYYLTTTIPMPNLLILQKNYHLQKNRRVVELIKILKKY
jgi:hypothetical protein